MKMTRILPTDKSGTIYYGPKTVAEAEKQIDEMDAPPADVVKMLREHGYTRVASIIAKRYGVAAK
jgi:hypothetical protein